MNQKPLHGKQVRGKLVKVKTERGNGCKCYYPHDNCLNSDCLCKFHEAFLTRPDNKV